MQNEGPPVRRPFVVSNSRLRRLDASLVVNFRSCLNNCASRCVDVIVILQVALFEVDIVVHNCGIEVELNFEPEDVSCGEAGICKGDIQGRLIADVGVRGRCCCRAGLCSVGCCGASCCGAGWCSVRRGCRSASCCGARRSRGVGCCGACRSCRIGCCSTARSCLRTTASRQAQARCQCRCCDERDNLLVQHFLPSLFVVYWLVRAKRNT